MIPVIKILPENTAHLQSSGYHLLVIIGDNDWQFALLNKQYRSLEAALGFHFEKTLDETGFGSHWDEVMKEYPMLDKFYSGVHVVYLASEAVLLPANEFSESQANVIINSMYGEQDTAVIRTDVVPSDNVKVVYRVPAQVSKAVQQTYLNADHKHYYSRELAALVNTGYHSLILVNFFGSQFSVCVMKERKLQLIQLYHYRQPEDVLYYLLTIAREFDCNQEDIPLLIGGMLDERSALYTELKKYFLDISFSPKPETVSCVAAFEASPLHYFHSLFTVASCV